MASKKQPSDMDSKAGWVPPEAVEKLHQQLHACKVEKRGLRAILRRTEESLLGGRRRRDDFLDTDPQEAAK